MYLPKHHLYPTTSQILHHLVLELFVTSPQYDKQKDPFFSIVPAGPIYKYGGILAAHRKQIFQSHPEYSTLVVIAGSDLPDGVGCVVTTDTVLHSFFGTIVLDPTSYASVANVNDDLFSQHAFGLEAQLPFIRGYKHLDGVVPYIVNTEKPQADVNMILDAIITHHGDDACYVFVQPLSGGEKFLAYADV